MVSPIQGKGRQVQTCRPFIGTGYSERDLLALALLVDDPRAAGQGQQSHAGVQGNTHITGIGTLCGGISGLGRGRGVAGSGLNIATGVAGPVSAVIVADLTHLLVANGADLPVIEPVVLPVTGGVVIGVNGDGQVGDLVAVCIKVLIAAGAVLVTLRTGGLTGGRDFVDPVTEGVVACVDLAAFKGFRALCTADAGLIIGRRCRAGGIARLVFVGCDLLTVGVGSVAVLAGVFGYIAGSLAFALVPVVGFIIAPILCPAMGKMMKILRTMIMILILL